MAGRLSIFRPLSSLSVISGQCFMKWNRPTTMADGLHMLGIRCFVLSIVSDYIQTSYIDERRISFSLSLFHISFAAAVHLSTIAFQVKVAGFLAQAQNFRTNLQSREAVASLQSQFSICTFSLRFTGNFRRSQGRCKAPSRHPND